MKHLLSLHIYYLNTYHPTATVCQTTLVGVFDRRNKPKRIVARRLNKPDWGLDKAYDQNISEIILLPFFFSLFKCRGKIMTIIMKKKIAQLTAQVFFFFFFSFTHIISLKAGR